MVSLLCVCRRGNWITLKMRKLIKPKSRERMRSLTLTPSRSESGDGFLIFPQDNQDSSSIGSGSNSLDDTLTQKRSSSEYRGNICTQEKNLVQIRTYPTKQHTVIVAVIKYSDTVSYTDGHMYMQKSEQNSYQLVPFNAEYSLTDT